jgi:hypothetical protein
MSLLFPEIRISSGGGSGGGLRGSSGGDNVDHLEVTKGRSEEAISFANISAAEVSTAMGMHWITIHLRKSAALGDRIDFLPQASLWGNLAAIQQLAIRLTARARQAGGGDS